VRTVVWTAAVGASLTGLVALLTGPPVTVAVAVMSAGLLSLQLRRVASRRRSGPALPEARLRK